MDKLHCPECGVHIDKHPAGRCLDAWVAKEVMGWERHSNMWMRRVDKGPLHLITAAYIDVWEPSTDIAAAWEVFNIRQLGSQVVGAMIVDPECCDVMEDIVTDIDENGWGKAWFCTHKGIPIYASTAPLAICRAAIKAVAG